MRSLVASTSIALALLIGAPVVAQQQEGQEPQQQAQQQQPKLSSDADNIIGKKAMTQQGKELGNIEDVLVGQDGKVQAAVVDHDGKKRAVPWDQITLQGDQVTVKMNEQQMSQLPEYKAEKD